MDMAYNMFSWDCLIILPITHLGHLPTKNVFDQLRMVENKMLCILNTDSSHRNADIIESARAMNRAFEKLLKNHISS